MRSHTTERIAANRMAVPVAENQSNLNTAAYGVASCTTGGIRATILSRNGTEILITMSYSAPPGANRALNGGMLHSVTVAVRNRNGDHARTICPAV